MMAIRSRQKMNIFDVPAGRSSEFMNVKPEDHPVRITDNDLLQQIRDLTGAGTQPVPEWIEGKVQPVLFVNQDAISATLTGGISGDLAVVNSTTTNKTTIKTQTKPENDSRSIVTFGNTKSGTAITAGSPATMYTVTSGKTFYLMGLMISANGGNGGEVLVSGTTKFGFRFGNDTGFWSLQSGEQPILKATTGQTIQVDAAGNLTAFYVGWGYEE